MPLLTQYKTFYISTSGDDTQSEGLNHFVKSHRIISVEKHFVNDEKGCGWAFLLEFSNSENGGSSVGTVTTKVDYKEILTPVDFALYDKLRQARKELSDKMKVPVFAIFSNENLSEMAKQRPDTVEKVAAIKGISKDKAEKYSSKFLEIIKEESQQNSTSEPADSKEDSGENMLF